MIDRLKAFFGSIAERGARDAIPADDTRVAAAALMVHVIDADGVRDAAEHRRLAESLSAAYAVSGEELARLMAAGEEADRGAVDLFAFTSVLNRKLDDAAKVEFIGILWEMVYADGERHELEDNIVWRVAELIGVSPRDRILERQRVRDAHGVAGPEPKD